jgi:multisubunit Na+/H+ antiporter MnhB subunit
MHTILSIVMLACCAIGIWSPMREGLAKNLSQWGPMALMLIAMADTTVGPGIVPGVVWGLLLLLTSPLPLVLLPKDRRSGMEIHRSLSIVAMFAILVTTLPAASSSSVHQAHAHSGLGGANPVLAVALAVAVIAYSIVLTVQTVRQDRRRGHRRRAPASLEALSSAGALGAMILMAV